MSIYSVYPSILEGIPETYIQVDGIHGKGTREIGRAHV